jgi:hypothetical protein
MGTTSEGFLDLVNATVTANHSKAFATWHRSDGIATDEYTFFGEVWQEAGAIALDLRNE